MQGGTTIGRFDFMTQYGPITIALISALVMVFVVWILIRLTNRFR